MSTAVQAIKEVLTNSKYRVLVLVGMLVVLIALEAVGDVSFSNWVDKMGATDSSGWWWFALGGLFYLLMAFVFAITLLTKKIGWVNTVWQGLSVVWGILWGVLYFKERPSALDWSGFSIILVGMVVLIVSKVSETTK